MTFDRITIDPGQMGGLPCVRSLRIPVITIVRLARSGISVEQILADYPDLERADIEQAVAFAAAALKLAGVMREEEAAIGGEIKIKILSHHEGDSDNDSKDDDDG